MNWSDVFLPILVQYAVPIVMSTAAGVIGLVSVKVGAAATKYLNVDITKKLNELFNAALNRTVEAVLADLKKGSSIPSLGLSTVAVKAVIEQMKKTMPDTLRDIGLGNDAAKLQSVVTKAVARGLAGK